ncbi:MULTISPECIES: transglycosylase domain-containing protein [unclassified Thermosynechococcus]|uniref:transglycosylase domain-containing protein n=1 Tax=unclassified Thermosynechococcus TaxID=2622553 RepID=UPI0028738486|nr:MULTISPECIES: transglycosylase domain-containing protein [unclassified Thermosynechococcus]WNC32317.1 transglycosylase domain-containing protein [Thermosynechococcus sp. PKX95]WNC34847.1 transglycosylase domain-containing protein [Thermosynechococcus sp. PKX91]WNC37363.1 transglycosylase domain-containing protein [Thermosynechococcus sp. WL11]WNC39885.1 transglycosylase domain-containing protein [Thermosynechococcus sp. WL17]WNC42405.1 transglycosylase domain-containing protein [Thermosynec
MPNPARDLWQSMTQTVTQAVQTVHSRFDWQQVSLRENARTPELWVEFKGQRQVFPLVGDRYILGRSQSRADIIVDAEIVSGTHARLKRLTPTGVFQIQDLDSTNGLYRQRKRLQTAELHHGDVITLGPPEVKGAVTLHFHNPPPLWVAVLTYSIWGIMGISALGIGLLSVEANKVAVRPLPPLEQGPIILLDRQGELINPVEDRPHRELKRLNEFSPYLVHGVLASEDVRYYWHFGVDPLGMARAVVTNLLTRQTREGASTLSQQLARTLFRSHVGMDESLGRKWREMAVALKLEFFYSKDELLLAYLNRVYLGMGNRGFEDAAQFYFDKPAKDLTLNEAATLVGILPAPNRFNPVRDYDAAVDYRNRVILRMVQQGYISKEEGDRARRSRIEISPKAREWLSTQRFPYYTDHVYQELAQLLGDELAQEGNLIVETGLDPRWQELAETSLRNFITSTGSAYGVHQGGLITLRPRDGLILALVGGVDYQKSQFNRATLALRQPGSTFKVFVYTEALLQGHRAGETFSCAPVFWQGQQFEGCRGGGGAMDLATALALSENPIALRLAQAVGLEATIQLARAMGITTPLQAVPGLVLGQSETTLLEMSGAFAVIANEGQRIPPHAIVSVRDGGDCKSTNDWQTCRLIYAASDERPQRVLDPAIANEMTHLLTAVVSRGTGRAAAIGRPVAGKTGTTNDGRDLWFIGYVPTADVLTGIWLGNDDNSPSQGSSGLAAALWGEYMGRALN